MKIVFFFILILVSIATTFVYQYTQQADINYYKGHRLFKKGRYKQAIAFFEKSLAADPSHPKALREIAYSYQWTGNPEKAVDAFRRILLKDPENYKAKRSLAQALSWNKEYRQAISLYKEIIGRKDDNASRKLLAQVYIWDGRPEIAERALEIALEKEPGDFSAKLLMAKAKHYAGKVKEAAKIYKEVLEQARRQEEQLEKKTGSKLKKGQKKIITAQKAEKQKGEKKEAIKTKELKALLAQAYTAGKDYEKGKEILTEILKEEPDNIEARVHLADIHAYNKDFDTAIEMYKDILLSSPAENLETKRKLADTLSWNKQYSQALELYGQIIKVKKDPAYMIQKARILGWARRYSEAVSEYKKALALQYDELIELEMKAKQAYWNNRVKSAIHYYKKLIEKDGSNVEAMFDLSQVYSYQSMFKAAAETYERILRVSPSHFRAKEGLEKVNLILNRAYLDVKYEFFEADSIGRDTDVNQSVFLNRLKAPLNDNFTFEADYELAKRSFSDFGGLLENKAGLGLSYRNVSWWQAGVFYSLSDFDRGLKELHTFGMNLTNRLFDSGAGSFSFERKKLNNSSTVLRGRYYKDDYNLGFDFDINRRAKLGLDCLYSYYSDSNHKIEPSLEALYYFTLEPKRFSFKYECFYRNFDKKAVVYFSPKGFWTNSAALNWRHFLNKEEIFFGADNIYYDLGYKASADSRNIVSHVFSFEFGWDISKHLNINIRASAVNSSASVYEDESIAAGLRCYF